MNTTNTSRHYVAQELVEQILLKLPAKSLLRFRFVSKSWDSLIRSERFVKTHLDNQASANHVIFFNYLDQKPGRRFSISTKDESTEVKQYHMHSFMKLMGDLPPHMWHSFRYPTTTTTTVLGSCNGLVCFSNSKRVMGLCCVYVCNPSTRTSIQLPRLTPRQWFTKCGFGFDEWSGAYKVFVKTPSDYDCLYRVYSSNTNAWRKLEMPKFHCGFSYRKWSGRKGKEEGILVSGNLHWPRTTETGENYTALVFDILTFDLKSEEFGTMDLPYDAGFPLSTPFSSKTSLGVLNGCLTAVYYHDEHLDVWVMVEYGVKESWIKVMDVAFCYNLSLNLDVATLCLGPNGEILMIYGGFFLAYDVKKRKLLQVKKFEAFRDGEGAHLFIESFVCPTRILGHHT